MNRAVELLSFLLRHPRAILALSTWPVFSVTSYLMMMRLLRQGLQPKTVIDVGANAGQFAIASLGLLPDPRVYSYEPLPNCIRRLRTMAANIPNWTIHPYAIGDRCGSTMFHVNTHCHSSSILKLAAPHRKAFPTACETESITVELSTLDDQFVNETLEGPVLLKVDVQGYELNVLEGARALLPRVDHVLLEVSFKPLYEGETVFRGILTVLEGLGFEFVRPVSFLSDPDSEEILQMDALFSRGLVPPASSRDIIIVTDAVDGSI